MANYGCKLGIVFIYVQSFQNTVLFEQREAEKAKQKKNA